MSVGVSTNRNTSVADRDNNHFSYLCRDGELERMVGRDLLSLLAIIR